MPKTRFPKKITLQLTEKHIEQGLNEFGYEATAFTCAVAQMTQERFPNLEIGVGISTVQIFYRQELEWVYYTLDAAGRKAVRAFDKAKQDGTRAKLPPPGPIVLTLC